MNHFKKLQVEFRTYIILFLVLSNLMILGGYVAAREIFKWDVALAIGAVAVSSLLIAVLFAAAIMGIVMVPLKALWQAILHVSRGESTEPAPDLERVSYGRELVTTLAHQVYDLAGSATLLPAKQAAPVTSEMPEDNGTPDEPSPATNAASHAAVDTADDSTTMSASLTEAQITDIALQATDALLESLPMPTFILDKQRVIRATNKTAVDYLGLPAEEVVDRPAADVLHLSFDTEQTLDTWLAGTAERATDTAHWNRVHLKHPTSGEKLYFDMAAYYNKDNPDGHEVILAFLDQTERYAAEDRSTGYVALAVHELRTPLTVLRGYIEALEEELEDVDKPELQEFMRKMSASAQTLTAFVSNILNVARVDEDELNLNLHEENWNDLLPEVCRDLELRARVRGKHLEYDIEAGLPTVAVDKISMYEVVSNLVENAIKYSPTTDKIIIHARTSQDGRVETVVEDFGIGVPSSAINGLFTKFYRSHRSKNQVSGTGLGLYLVKAIVSAHGGNVWVQSKEDQGSSFGFSLLPYAELSEEQKASHNHEITRHPHGWIKNHSTTRR